MYHVPHTFKLIIKSQSKETLDSWSIREITFKVEILPKRRRCFHESNMKYEDLLHATTRSM